MANEKFYNGRHYAVGGGGQPHGIQALRGIATGSDWGKQVPPTGARPEGAVQWEGSTDRGRYIRVYPNIRMHRSKDVCSLFGVVSRAR